MSEYREPIPGWAKLLLWINDKFIFYAPGRPVCQVRWAVNFHKIFTLFLIYGMMLLTGNFSNDAWVYLALHGIYGYCWLIKDYGFRDLQFEHKISAFGVFNLYVLLVGWYWLTPWLFLSRHIVLSGPELFVAVAIHTLGVVIMIAGDGQRHWVMKYNKGLMNFGMYRYTRNPNYLGEIMLYFSYAFMARHWASWLIFVYMTVYFLARMKRKDHSISRYPGWEEYKKESGIVIPWALLNSRAWWNLFGKPKPEVSEQ
jgi:protein-S-isoprenylcysteine O-methyltransferase Ste14